MLVDVAVDTLNTHQEAATVGTTSRLARLDIRGGGHFTTISFKIINLRNKSFPFSTLRSEHNSFLDTLLSSKMTLKLEKQAPQSPPNSSDWRAQRLAC